MVCLFSLLHDSSLGLSCSSLAAQEKPLGPIWVQYCDLTMKTLLSLGFFWVLQYPNLLPKNPPFAELHVRLKQFLSNSAQLFRTISLQFDVQNGVSVFQFFHVFDFIPFPVKNTIFNFDRRYSA